MLSSTGCLVTSTPSYDTPQQTPPMLLGAAAHPLLTKPSYLFNDGRGQSLPFGASVMSEDADQDVRFVLLVDYGSSGNGMPPNPYQKQPVFAPSDVPAGTLAEGPRTTPTLSIDGEEFDAMSGTATCHTVTMVASHHFPPDGSGCPVCITDSSMLTWLVIVCPSSNGTTCDPGYTLSTSNCELLTTDWHNGCPTENDDAGTCPFQSLTGNADAG